MEFSVVIPCYNSAETLTRALDSITVQNCKSAEVILVDDGSTDATATIVREYQQRSDLTIHLIQQENQGPGAARNKGIEVTSGNILLFLDADDAFEENAFSIVRETFDKNTGLEMLIGGYRAIHQNKQKENLPRSLGKTPYTRLKNYLLGDFNISMGAVALKKEALKNIRFANELRNGEDIVFYSFCLSLLNCTTTPHFFVNVFHAPDSQRNQKEQALQTGEKIPDLIFSRKDLPQEVYALKLPYLAHRYISLAKMAIKLKKQTEAKQLLFKAIKTDPRVLTNLRTYKTLLKLIFPKFS